MRLIVHILTITINWSFNLNLKFLAFKSLFLLKIKNHSIKRCLFLPHTSFRASCSLLSPTLKRGHEALKPVCGRNKRLLILWILIFNLSSKLN